MCAQLWHFHDIKSHSTQREFIKKKKKMIIIGRSRDRQNTCIGILYVCNKQSMIITMTPIDINFINLVIFWSKLINKFTNERQKIFVFLVFDRFSPYHNIIIKIYILERELYWNPQTRLSSLLYISL